MAQNSVLHILNQLLDTIFGTSGDQKIRVYEPEPAILETIEVQTQTNATSIGVGTAAELRGYSNQTIVVDIGTSATVVVNVSKNGTDWQILQYDAYGNDISSGVAFTSDGLIQTKGDFPYMQTELTAVSGACSIYVTGGN